MVDLVAWTAVAVVALFAVVGFTGVVATSVLTLVRHLRHQPAPQRVDERRRVSAVV